jgi:hypothetical protein
MDARRPGIGTTTIALSVTVVILAGSLIFIAAYPESIAQPADMTTTRTMTVTSQNTRIETITTTVAKVACISSGGPAGVYLRIISDSTLAAVPGADVTAMNQPLFCGGFPETSQSAVTFTTNGTNWYPFSGELNGGYSFSVKYSGQFYFFAAVLRPISITCAILFVPSGRTNVTITSGRTSCP